MSFEDLFKSKKYHDIVDKTADSAKDRFIKSMAYKKLNMYYESFKIMKELFISTEKIDKTYSTVRDRFIDIARLYYTDNLKKRDEINIKYPSTPHFIFSQSVSADDKVDNNIDKFKNREIVITEKLDGENCCIYRGEVYARTHSRTAKHSSFDTIKDMHNNFIKHFLIRYRIPESYMLFGENMTAVHCINYDRLDSYFYLFGIYDTEYDSWLSWDEVVAIADMINVPTVPVIKRYFVDDTDSIKNICERYTRSFFSEDEPEGCVVRTVDRFSDFNGNVSKYVRKGLVLRSVWTEDFNKVKLQKTRIPKLTILVGYPGSGKSTFADALRRSDDSVVVINQDKLGNLSECEKLFSSKFKTSKIVVDRCNLKNSDLYRWKELSFNEKSTEIVFFDTPVHVCRLRVRTRRDHETLKTDTENVFKDIDKKLEIPEKCIKLRSTEDTNALLTQWNCFTIDEDIDLIKYPKTEHLCDIRDLYKDAKCSVSRDDRIVSDITDFINRDLYVEEKIDGANIGITYDTFKNCYRVQNRSKYINKETMNQFEKLDEWLEHRSADLYKILKTGNFTLFGEWCYSVHGIEYTSLPDYFIAFDILDRRVNRFLSRTIFYDIMKRTDISIVPLITYKSFSSLEEFRSLLEMRSEYSDSVLEGIVLRYDDKDFLHRKSKIVGKEFTENLGVSWLKKESKKNQKKMNN